MTSPHWPGPAHVRQAIIACVVVTLFGPLCGAACGGKENASGAQPSAATPSDLAAFTESLLSPWPPASFIMMSMS